MSAEEIKQTEEEMDDQELFEEDEVDEADERRAALKAKIKKEVKEWAIALVTALVVVLAVRFFLFTIIRVDGSSMEPTLQDHERLFVTVADVKLGNIDRGDVVICHYPNRGSTYFVKRVVGVPGDVVYRERGVTYVNGEPIDPMGISYQILYDYEPYTLGEEEYFCVGDNLYFSHDSRDWKDSDPSHDVGPLSEDMIEGKVRYVIWPLNSIRAVE